MSSTLIQFAHKGVSSPSILIELWQDSTEAAQEVRCWTSSGHRREGDGIFREGRRPGACERAVVPQCGTWLRLCGRMVAGASHEPLRPLSPRHQSPEVSGQVRKHVCRRFCVNLPRQILGMKPTKSSKEKSQSNKGSLLDDTNVEVHMSDITDEAGVPRVSALVALVLALILQEMLPLNYYQKHKVVYAELLQLLGASQVVATTPEYGLLMQCIESRVFTDDWSASMTCVSFPACVPHVMSWHTVSPDPGCDPELHGPRHGA